MCEGSSTHFVFPTCVSGVAVAKEQEAASTEPGGRKRATANAKNTKWDLPRVIHRLCRSGKAKDEPKGVRNSLGTAIVLEQK